jgi:hypothetical protein
LDKEERELQIRLAQLNAKLQTDITEAFGLLAAALVFFVFAYQVGKENFNYISITAWIVAFASMLVAFVCVHRTSACLDEFKKLH